MVSDLPTFFDVVQLLCTLKPETSGRRLMQFSAREIQCPILTRQKMLKASASGALLRDVTLTESE